MAFKECSSINERIVSHFFSEVLVFIVFKINVVVR